MSHDLVKFRRSLGWIQLGIAALVVMTITVGLCVFTGREKERKDEQLGSPHKDPDPTMKLTRVVYEEMEKGKRIWIVKAREARYYEDCKKLLLSKVRLAFFLKSGDKILSESKHGILYSDSGNIRLWGEVRVTLPDDYEVFTEEIHYNSGTERISSETPIRIERPDLCLKGNSWYYDIPKQQASFKGPIKGRLNFLILEEK